MGNTGGGVSALTHTQTQSHTCGDNFTVLVHIGDKVVFVHASYTVCIRTQFKTNHTT